VSRRSGPSAEAMRKARYADRIARLKEPVANKLEPPPASPDSNNGAPDWVLLDFSHDVLPEEFAVKFSDKGAGWGEWSAIALKSD